MHIGYESQNYNGNEAFNRKKQLLSNKLDKDVRKRLEKRLEVFKMSLWRRMEGISWMDTVTRVKKCWLGLEKREEGEE